MLNMLSLSVGIIKRERGKRYREKDLTSERGGEGVRAPNQGDSLFYAQTAEPEDTEGPKFHIKHNCNSDR